MDIGTRREVFWDDYIVDTVKTTAEKRLGKFTFKGKTFTFDKPWEGDGCNFFDIFYDDQYKAGKYRMYYSAWHTLSPGEDRHTEDSVKYAHLESADGVHWERTDVGIYSYRGSLDNNIVAVPGMDDFPPFMDNFFVFVDDNPNRTVKERYKAIVEYAPKGTWSLECPPCLTSFLSDDGFRWRRGPDITRDGKFDSLNTCHWNKEKGKYLCYFRDFHYPDGRPVEKTTEVYSHPQLKRDIKVVESEDFIHWSEARRIDYGECEDVHLYTNCVAPYARAPQMLTGFPTRYIQRSEWTGNYDRLCGKEKRENRFKIEPRFGLAVTDCLFMCSRDGHEWTRYDEAIFRPESENGRNWVYGDCYPAVGMIETPSDIEGADSELTFYLHENHWMSLPAVMLRYTIRKDGFVSRHAGIQPKRVVTKEFTFEGSTMLLNFATSARGYLYITVRDTETGKELHSGEIFGNRTDRIIDFDGDLAEFSGKKVIMEIEMCDADVYAFKYE